MTTLENVSRESLEKALRDIRRDVGNLYGVVGIASGGSDVWLAMIAWIGLTHLIQANWHMGFGSAGAMGGCVVYGCYLLQSFEAHKKVKM